MSVSAATDKKIVDIDQAKPIEVKKQNLDKQQVKTEVKSETETTNTNLNDREFAGKVVKDKLQANYGAENKIYIPIVMNGDEQVDPKNVEQAVNTITDNLSQGITDWDVTHGDLENIQKTFNGLNSAEANQVFDRLTSDQINTWTQEINGMNGGFNDAEKKDLFNDLAGKLTGENMAEFARSFGDKERDVQNIGKAVGQNATAENKVDFVNNLAEHADNNPAVSKAIAETIIGLGKNPAALDKAIGSMTDNQLRNVMDEISSSSNTVVSTYGASHSINFDGELLGKVLESVSNSNNVDVKARVFNAAALQLKSIDDTPSIIPSTGVVGKGDAVNDIRNGLTAILNSDTNGIITELEKDNLGEGMEAYVKTMLNGGEATQKQVGTLVGKLLAGNDGNENQIARFEQQIPGTTGAPYYQNARTLGFFAGTVHSATSSITGDRDRQGDILKNIFDTAAGLAGIENPVTASLAKGLSIELVDQVVGELNNRSLDLRNAIINLALPHDANDDLYTGPARTSWDASFASTALQNDG